MTDKPTALTVAEECSTLNIILEQSKDVADNMLGTTLANADISLEHLKKYCAHTEDIETIAATMTPKHHRALNRPDYRFCNFGHNTRTHIFSKVIPDHGAFFISAAAKDFSNNLWDLFENDNDFSYCEIDNALGFDVPQTGPANNTPPQKSR